MVKESGVHGRTVDEAIVAEKFFRSLGLTTFLKNIGQDTIHKSNADSMNVVLTK